MRPPDKFTPQEVGLAVARLQARVSIDDLEWWRKVDYEAAVRFWCPDLSSRAFTVGGHTYHEVVEPSGRRVCYGLSERGAWVTALALIFDHMVNIKRMRRIRSLYKGAGR